MLHLIQVGTGRTLGSYQVPVGKIQAVAFCNREQVAVGGQKLFFQLGAVVDLDRHHAPQDVEAVEGRAHSS